MATRRKATTKTIAKTKHTEYLEFFDALPTERQEVHLGVLVRFILALSVDAERAKAALDKAHKECFGNKEEHYDIDVMPTVRRIEAK